MALSNSQKATPLKRDDAIKRAAGMLGLKRREVEEASAITASVVQMELTLHGRVRIKRLGSFNVKQRAARMGRHPVSGEPLPIPARAHVQFRPAKQLIDVVD